MSADAEIIVTGNYINVGNPLRKFTFTVARDSGEPFHVKTTKLDEGEFLRAEIVLTPSDFDMRVLCGLGKKEGDVDDDSV